MNITDLPKVIKKRKRRLGQGHGSGRVKTSGRGTKGQNAKSKRSISFEGGAVSLIKRLPFRRGKNKNKSFKKRPAIVNLSALSLFKKGETVDLKTLLEKKIINKDQAILGVKILGDGEITVSLKVTLSTSKQAAQKIRMAGGTITT